MWTFVDLVNWVHSSLSNRLSDNVLQVFILADLDNVVAVVSLLKHFPEVPSDAVNISIFVETYSVVVCLKSVVPLGRTLLAQHQANVFINDWPWIIATILDEGSPLFDPIWADYVVCQPTFDLIERFGVLSCLVEIKLILDSLFGPITDQVWIFVRLWIQNPVLLYTSRFVIFDLAILLTLLLCWLYKFEK